MADAVHWERISVTMTVTLKDKEPLVVPVGIRRRAGFRSGQEVEFKVSGGAITIVPKPSRDEVLDEREILDPKVRAIIRRGREEFLAGRARPIQEFIAERGQRARKRSQPRFGR